MMQDDIREKRKRKLKRKAVADKVKGVLTWILVVFFWIVVVFAVVGGVFGTFVHSTGEEPDYEEYIHSLIP